MISGFLSVFWLLNLGVASSSFAAPNTATRARSHSAVSQRFTNPQPAYLPKQHQFQQQKHYYHQRYLLSLRGGEQQVSEPFDGSESESTTSAAPTTPPKTTQMSMISVAFVSFGQFYVKYLEQAPIRTKSLTAGCIFAMSDWLAQTIEKSSNSEKVYDRKRTVAASLVGLLYFGPAAHYWYENIFRLFPATGLVSTLQKALMGQLFFGPSFTCIFFATALLQSGNFTFGNWFRKIKSDLAGAWLAGAGFWPLVDLVSYSLVPPRFIPLFVNVCSLVWNIYLSIVANRKSNKAATA